MGSPGDLASDGIVDRVVVHMHGHSKDVEGDSRGSNEQHAVVAREVNLIVYGTSLYPGCVDLEPQGRQLIDVFALGRHRPIGILPVIDSAIFEKLSHYVFKVEAGDVESGGTCIND